MNVVAVTACPTGIAHSQMAAENLENAAEEMGHDVHVEVEGAMGTENELSDQQIADADVVIVAADTTVRTDRFGDTPVVKGGVQDAVNDAEGLVREAEERVDAAEASTEPGDGEAVDVGSDQAGADATAASDDETADTDQGTADADRSGAGARDEGDRQGIVGKLKSLFS